MIDRSNPRPLPTVTQDFPGTLHSAPTELATQLIARNDIEVWLNLRNEQGRRKCNADRANGRNGQIECGRVCGSDCSTSLVKTLRKSVDYICVWGMLTHTASQPSPRDLEWQGINAMQVTTPPQMARVRAAAMIRAQTTASTEGPSGCCSF